MFDRLILRIADEFDFEALYGILLDRSVWLRANGIDQWRTPYPESRFRAEIALGAVFAVEFNGSIAGTVTLLDTRPDYYPTEVWNDDEPAWYLCRLAVALEFAGRGIGPRILDLIERRAIAAGISRLRLDVVASNPFLARYYLRYGFNAQAEATYFGTLALFLEKQLRR